MNENQAIDLALRLHHKHILPSGPYDERETVVIQNMADLYKAGYEVVPAKRELKLGGTISREDVETLLKDGVIY